MPTKKLLPAVLSAALVALGPLALAAQEVDHLALGEVTVLSGPESCDGHRCWEIEVVCPQLVEPARALVKVGAADGEERAVVAFTTGGAGRGLWESASPAARAAIANLRAHGLTTAQLAWIDGWLLGAPGALEGHARLACRPATAYRWIRDTFASPAAAPDAPDTVRRPAFCATGNSGGSAQISYTLARYRLAGLFDLAIPTGGPPMGRIDLGCSDDPRYEPLRYGEGSANLIDRGFGFPGDGTGPCATADPDFAESFRAASVNAPGGDYRYPRTSVWFLYGAQDESNAVPQGRLYAARLVAAGSSGVHHVVVPATGHAVHGSRPGVTVIRDLLLDGCRPRPVPSPPPAGD